MEDQNLYVASGVIAFLLILISAIIFKGFNKIGGKVIGWLLLLALAFGIIWWIATVGSQLSFPALELVTLESQASKWMSRNRQKLAEEGWEEFVPHGVIPAANVLYVKRRVGPDEAVKVFELPPSRMISCQVALELLDEGGRPINPHTDVLLAPNGAGAPVHHPWHRGRFVLHADLVPASTPSRVGFKSPAPGVIYGALIF